MAQNIGQAYVQIVPSSDGISGSIEKVLGGEAASAGQKTGATLAKGIGGALAGGAAAVAGGVAAISGAIVKGTTDLGAYGDSIDKASQKMGISAEAYQEWDAVMQHSGTSMAAMQSSMKSLTKAVAGGSDAFKEIGISAEALDGMSREEIFNATIAGLQGISDEGERAQLASELLGKGAIELGALLNTSAEDTQAMKDRVHELGGVMSDEAIKNAAAFQDNLQDLQTAVQGIGRGLIADLLPGVNGILSGFTALIAGEEGATEQISAGFQNLFASLTGIIGQIVSMLSEMMPQVINTIIEVLPELISLSAQLIGSLVEGIVTSAPQLFEAVLGMLSELVAMMSESMSTDMPTTGMQAITEFISGLAQLLPDLIQLGVDVLMMLIDGIVNMLPSLVSMAGEVIVTLVGALAENLPTILDAGIQVLLALVDGIIQCLPQLIPAIVQVVTQIITALTQHLPELLKAGMTLLLEIAKGLIQAIPDLVAGIPQIIQSIVNTFGDFDWSEIGHSIMDGIKNGILSKIDSVIEAAKSGAQRVLDAAKGFLQIGSPSRVFAREVGRWIPEGIAVGIRENMDSVTDEMRKAADLTEMAYQSALSISAPELSAASSDTNATLALILQMLMQYFPEFEQNKGLNGTDIYNIVNRQMGMAVIS